MSVQRSDILFVFAPGPRSGGSFNRHLGVAYLRATLAKAGISTTQYLNAQPGTIDAVATDIIAQKCPIVGFTVYDTNAHLSIAIAESIKRQEPDTKVVFGGPSATFNAQLLMERNKAIDLCVMGEAEETGSAILTKVLDGGSFDDGQPGIAFRRNGEVVCTSLPPLVGCGKPGGQDGLDVIPSPYLSGILTDGQDGVLTGRGCTHHCQYCCFAALGRQRLRLHSVERVVAELECISEHQKRNGRASGVAFFDDAFTLVPERAKALCQTIANRKLGLSLSCITRADTIDEELIALMQDAGFKTINFGLESAVPSVLRASGKVRPPDWRDPDLMPEREFVERVRKAVLLAKKYGFDVSVNVILGLPKETPADAAETLAFVKQLPVNLYFHNFLWVYPGTKLWMTHDQYSVTCAIDRSGLPQTTGHAYDLKSVRPAPNSELGEAAQLLRLLATDALVSCGESSVNGRGTHTVILDVEELSTEITLWLRNILNIGGLVIQKYREMNLRERSARFDRDRCMLSDHLVPYRHYIQIWPRCLIGVDVHWEFTSSHVDVFTHHEPELLSIVDSPKPDALISWASGLKADAVICDISEYLHNPEELLRIMDQTDAADTISPFQLMPKPPHVKYPGRWLRGNAPPCLSLGRLEVTKSGEVRCCLHGQDIGKVGDSTTALSTRLSEAVKAVEQRRGCANCNHIDCPRCPFPGIDDHDYCQIVAGQERARRALDWIWAYSRIPLYAAVGRNG